MVTKKEGFHKISRGHFRKSKFSRLGGVQEVGILPNLVYFYHKGCFGSISTLRSHLALFSSLRGSLAWVKTTLIVVLRPICGRFCVLICGCVICSKKMFRYCLD